MDADRRRRLERYSGLAKTLALAAGLCLASLGLFGAAEPNAPARVVLHVALEGQPVDALIQAFRAEGQLAAVEYTDVLTPGEARLELVPGAYTLSIEHGAGFLSEPEQLELTLEAGTARELSVELKRQFDPRAEGYYSVDTHAHSEAGNPAMKRDFGIPNEAATPTDRLVGVQLAEGLDVVFLSDHNSVDGHALFAEIAQARGVPFLLSEEITTLKWGHFNPYTLEPGALVAYSPTKTPSEYFAEARANGAAIIQINHPLEPGLGYFFARSKPEFDDSFDVVEVFNGPYTEDDRYAVEQLFRYWNEGKRYVAVGVSDDHDWKEMSVRYGMVRTYVHLGATPLSGQRDVERFLEALKAGHAFATYGPLVFVEANDGAIPGDTLPLKPNEAVQLRIKIQSVQPLDEVRAEIVKDGRRVATFELSGHEHLLEFEDQPMQNAWYAVRLRSSQQDLALTNPIWIEVQP